MTVEERGQYPTWVRALLVALGLAGLGAGVAVGNATYTAWSQPDDPADATTTTSVEPEVPEPPATLG